MAAPENFLWGGALRGQNAILRGQKSKICRKRLILAIFSSDWGQVGGGGRASDWGEGAFASHAPPPPLMPPLEVACYNVMCLVVCCRDLPPNQGGKYTGFGNTPVNMPKSNSNQEIYNNAMSSLASVSITIIVRNKHPSFITPPLFETKNCW